MNGSSHRPLFAPIHCVISRYERPNRPRLHLDKNQHLTVTTNQINLLSTVSRSAPVLYDDHKVAVALQPFRSLRLTT